MKILLFNFKLNTILKAAGISSFYERLWNRVLIPALIPAYD